MGIGNPYPISDVRWAEWECVHNGRRFCATLGGITYGAIDDTDVDQATADAFCDAVSAWLWPRAQGFIAGAFFTVGAAWVWSWFL